MTEDAQQQTGEGSKHGNLMQESYKTCLVYHAKAFLALFAEVAEPALSTEV